MTNPPKLTLERWAALDQAVSEYIPDWQGAIFACSESELDFGKAGVLFLSAPNEAGVESVTTFLAASRQAPTRLLAALRGLAAEWEQSAKQNPQPCGGDNCRVCTLSKCYAQLRALIEQTDLAAPRAGEGV